MDTLWRIELMGSLRAFHDADILTRFRTQKTAVLLAYLAYHLDRAHPRDLICELLWPESNLDSSRNNLRVALSSLRRQLEPPGTGGALILADRTTVRLNPEAVSTDVAGFETALAAARSAGEPAEQARCLARAADLYRGPLLYGYYEDWVLAEQQRLSDLFFFAVRDLAGLLIHSGDPASAVPFARRLVEQDPLREEAHRELLRLYAAAGRVPEAEHQYGALESLLGKELGDEPSGETQRLMEQIRSGEWRPAKAEAASLRSGTLPAGRSVVAEPAIAVSGGDAALPSGTTTFLLADLQAGAIASELEATLARTTWAYGGEVAQAGGFFAAVFPRAGYAAECAATLQRMPAAPAPGGGPALGSEMASRLRVALDTCDRPLPDPADLTGALRSTRRVLLAAHPGQILCSEATAALARSGLEEMRLVDLGPYRLEGEARSERLYQLDYPGMPEQGFPPPPRPAAVPAFTGFLPPQVSRFFGREGEIQELTLLLTDPQIRLVTLQGPGGTGKTRLAVEAARRLVDAFHGAVWFVSLADVSDPGLLPATILELLRIPQRPGAHLLEQVEEALLGQPCLLVLDNFEQLVPEGVPAVQALLERVASLTVLTTSRVSLGLAAERQFWVNPLPTPASPDSPERLARWPCIQLFLDRARAVRPDFGVTPGNAPALAALCERLEGIPLAVELAAARVRALSPAQMLEHLEHRLEFLVSRRRDAILRHRTLRAAIDWSYRLLSPEARLLFALLSVFHGGWTLEAAQAVCGGAPATATLPRRNTQRPAPEPLDLAAPVLDLLELLQEASLVTSEEAPGGALRFRMLETLREYARECLTPEEALGAERRHAAHFLRFAEERTARLRTSDERGALDVLGAEIPNLRAALAWAHRAGESETCARLALALFEVLYHRDLWQEAQQVLVTALEALDDGMEAQDSLRAALLHALGTVADDLGHLEWARSCAEESLTLRRHLGDAVALANSLNLSGALAMNAGDYGPARERLREALEALPREQPARRGLVLHNQALLAARAGDSEAARRLYEEALVERRAAGDQRGEGETLRNLGALLFGSGELSAACRFYHRGLEISRALEDRMETAVLLFNLAEIAEATGDAATAGGLFLHSESLFRELQSPLVSLAAEAAARLGGSLGPDAWSRVREALPSLPWEELIQRPACTADPPGL
jgi:predicted ATPase/DNA-binding SARP family transcriptional activator